MAENDSLTCKGLTTAHDALPAEPAAAKEAAKTAMDKACAGADQEAIRIFLIV